MKKILHNKFIITVLLLLCWLISGIVIVPPEHEALIYENDVYQKTVKDYSWHLPAPFGTHIYSPLKIRQSTFVFPLVLEPVNNTGIDIELDVRFEVVNAHTYMNNGLEKVMVYGKFNKEKELPGNSIEPILLNVWTLSQPKIKKLVQENVGDNSNLLKKITNLLTQQLKKTENSQQLGIKWRPLVLKFIKDQTIHLQTSLSELGEERINNDVTSFNHLPNYQTLVDINQQLLKLKQQLNDAEKTSEQQMNTVKEKLQRYEQEQENQIDLAIKNFQEDYNFYRANPKINGWRLYYRALKINAKNSAVVANTRNKTEQIKTSANINIDKAALAPIPTDIEELTKLLEI